MDDLKAPFPWFGGKSRVAGLVWERFGKVNNYVEPFFGSGAVLLGAPRIHSTETVNDLDGFVCNFWRAIGKDPEKVASYADNPVNENDLHARHIWLVNHRDELVPRLEGDPDYYDAKIAGWWVWGICCWIGGEFCSGKGPWQIIDGQLVHLGSSGQGVSRRRVHLGNAGKGVNRKRVHLGNAGKGVNRKLVHLGNAGLGVNRKLVHLGDAGLGLHDWFKKLACRLRNVRVCCGDWSRICGPMPTVKIGTTAMFLDPPYGKDADRYDNLYVNDSLSVAGDVARWAIEHGDDPLMRIALCGYEGEHNMPDSWECIAWKANGGYASQGSKENVNATRERVWFSPHCERSGQMSMF